MGSCRNLHVCASLLGNLSPVFSRATRVNLWNRRCSHGRPRDQHTPAVIGLPQHALGRVHCCVQHVEITTLQLVTHASGRQSRKLNGVKEIARLAASSTPARMSLHNAHFQLPRRPWALGSCVRLVPMTESDLPYNRS